MSRKKGRPVNGMLLLNKSAGMTSNAALQQAKRLFFAQKAGHTGSLDPLATGVLPICFGETSKFSQYLLDADKRYISRVKFGVATETGDADGAVVATADASGLTAAKIEAVLPEFRGHISQIPSMYSALKYQGKPLYQWAREGITVPRQPRDIVVFEYKLLDFYPGPEAQADIEVHCSKGTYIRTLAEDLGNALGVGAHVVRLHRSNAGTFADTSSITLDDLSVERGEQSADILDHHLLPVDAPVQSLPSIAIPEGTSFYFSQGQAVMHTKVYRLCTEGDMVRVFADSGDFLGVGKVTDDGRIAPKRLVSTIGQ